MAALSWTSLRRATRAVMCVFTARGRAHYYLGGFDESLERLSPGTALTGYAIESAIADGVLEFDFLRRGEPYKYRWGAVDRPNFRLLIHKPMESRPPESSGRRPVENALQRWNVTQNRNRINSAILA